MNTTQQDSAMSVLYEVIIFFAFSFFFVYHKKLHKTSITVLLACVTLNFMDTSRPIWELLTQELTRSRTTVCRSSPRPEAFQTEISSW